MPVTPERRGAIERLTVDLAAELASRGHDATVITVGEPPLERYEAESVSFVETAEPIERPPSHVFPVRSFGKQAADAAAKVHASDPIDILHAVYYPILLGFDAPDEVPVVVTEHNAHPWQKEHRFINDLSIIHRLRWEADSYIRLAEAHASFAGAERVFSVSDAQGKWIDRCVPEFRGRRQTMYDYVDTSKFTPDADRSNVSLPDAPTVLYAGRKVPHKGLHRAVAALSMLDSEVRLAVLGPAGPGFSDGDTFDEAAVTDADPYLRRVFEIADEHGVADRISFTGYVPDATLPGYYAAADVVAFPSVLESFGLVPVEAMACGTPVVAHDVPPMTETVVDGETGFLTTPTASDLGRALDDLLGHPERAAAFGRAGRDYVVETFSLGGQASAHLAQYRAVTGRDTE